MTKIIGKWKLFILTTSNHEEEKRQIEAIQKALKGGIYEPDFEIRLVGLPEDYARTVQTSTIVCIEALVNDINFKTHSGSVYSCDSNLFTGIYCLTTKGERKLA